MPTMLTRTAAAFAVSGLVISALAAEPAGPPFPTFEDHGIEKIGTQLGQTALVDVDRDGDLDYVCGQADRVGGEVWWWEYQAPDKWVRHLMGKGHTDVGGAAFDVNGDGWIDFLAGGRLLINTGKPRTEPFKVHEVGTIHSHDTAFADINGDGKMDAIANSDRTGLFWYEIPSDPTRKWTQHTIALAVDHKIHGGVSPQAVGDLDGDGDADVVTAQAWYENVDGKGLKWKRDAIDFGQKDRYGIAVKTWVADMDGDKDLDFVQAEGDVPDGRVAWFENDGKGRFTRHIIKEKGDKQDFHSLAVADFDTDGDLDVFSGGGPLSPDKSYICYVWENAGGGKWIEHIVARRNCHEAVAADVDGDGDIDICFKPWSGSNEHVYLRNMRK